VYLDNTMENSSSMVGAAEVGGSRPDVASALRNPAFTYSGFNMLWTPSGISPGTHTLYVYAHAASGWTSKTVSITMQAGPTMSEQRPNDRGYDGRYDRGNRYGGRYDRGYDSMYDSGNGGMYGGYPGSYGGSSGFYGGYPGSSYYDQYLPCQGVYGGACGGLFPPNYPFQTYPPSNYGQPCILIYPPPPGC